MYSPQRDLAYIYAPAMSEAIVALDQVNWTDEIKEICTALKITEEDIARAAERLTEAHRFFVSHSDIKTPNDALERVDWYDVHPGARYLVYGRLGEVMLGGFFIALRDTSRFADESSQAKEIAEFIAAGKGVMARSSGLSPEPSRVAELHQQVRGLQEELIGVRDALQAARDALAQSDHVAREKQRELATARTVSERLVTAFAAGMARVAGMGFWQRVAWVFSSEEMRSQWLNQLSGMDTKSSSSET